jgi:hypothetical protein
MRFIHKMTCSTVIATAFLMSGCAVTPTNTMVQAMPGPGKSFQAFQDDLGACKTFAGQQVAGQAEALNQRAAAGAVLSTVLGAAVGGAASQTGAGAGIGAAAGSAIGTAVASDATAAAQQGLQGQYDNAFSQCMYARGNIVPGFGPPPSQYAAASQPAPDPQVRSIQQQLIRLGYLKGGADGYMGRMTASAIREFERANGMAPNGAPSGTLLARLQTTTVAASAAPAAGSSSSSWVAPVSASAPAQPAMVHPAMVQPVMVQPVSVKE